MSIERLSTCCHFKFKSSSWELKCSLFGLPLRSEEIACSRWRDSTCISTTSSNIQLMCSCCSFRRFLHQRPVSLMFLIKGEVFRLFQNPFCVDLRFWYFSTERNQPNRLVSYKSWPCILEVSGSNLRWNTGYSRGFLALLKPLKQTQGWYFYHSATPFF